LRIVRPDAAFPNMTLGDPNATNWRWMRKGLGHNWYVDRRRPTIGFVTRDEAAILYNSALQFRGKRALEIGVWLGWSACHLALAGVELDAVDPMLTLPGFLHNVTQHLTAAGV